jgi:hypothetical protein
MGMGDLFHAVAGLLLPVCTGYFELDRLYLARNNCVFERTNPIYISANGLMQHIKRTEVQLKGKAQGKWR